MRRFLKGHCSGKIKSGNFFSYVRKDSQGEGIGMLSEIPNQFIGIEMVLKN